MSQPATAQAAIAAALSHLWKDAISLNSELLKKNSSDIAALNRLGYAYAQNGQRQRAKTTFENVLALDPYNQIALKHMRNVGMVRKKSSIESTNHISPLSFLEEPGVTKIVAAVNLAPAQTVALLTPGMELMLKPRNHCIEVRLPPKTYIAALPDDLSYKLLKLIASGNRYRVIIKSVDKKSLVLMLREVVRGKKFAGQPSFTSPPISMPSGSHLSIDHDGNKSPDGPMRENEGTTPEESQEEA